jgi:hypothetical protein
LLVAGCASKADVSGKVLLRGKPIKSGAVTFVWPDLARSARVEEDGSYSFSAIPTGNVKIAVVAVAPRAGASNAITKAMKQELKSKKVQMSDDIRENMPDAVKEGLEGGAATLQHGGIIPRRYGDPDQSGLDYTVTAGEQAHDIELK